MKKVMYALIVPLLVAGGIVFANSKTKNDSSEKTTPILLAASEREDGRKIWEATPDGIKYKQWEASPGGQKVLAGVAKIREHINAFTDMEAVITSLSLPPGSRLGFGIMVRIEGVDYIVNFEPEASQLEQLRSLKVNDKIIIRSHTVSQAPKYAYPIIKADSVERDGKLIYKRTPRKGDC